MASEGAASRRPPLAPPPKRRASADLQSSDVLTYKRRRRATKSNSSSDPNTAQMGLMAARSSNSQQAGHQPLARHWRSWRNTLEGFLQSPSVNQGPGGIQNCIRDALRYNGCQPLVQLTPAVTQGNLANGHGEARESPSGPVHGQQNNGALVPVEAGTVASLEANKAMCNNALFDILISEKFALLCDCLAATFNIDKPDEVIGLANIDSRMINGDYAQNPKLFDHDIKQIWEKFEQIGREMAVLASSLSVISRASYQKQASGLSEIDITEHKTEPKEDPDAVSRTELAAETQESAVASMEEDSEPDLSTTALSNLCKHCGTCEDEDKRFLMVVIYEGLFMATVIGGVCSAEDSKARDGWSPNSRMKEETELDIRMAIACTAETARNAD
ncbi:hypothetical protein PR202_ga30968 [Eleusine coracana subsp. coracana]|uniref:Uncharacterized protein n=1 Tax=Eleusine coracana subsp. coracana TaxID=191504 RepID=A0AAV5DR09_ELECO|nr:hypothetical protein PR202_ga30968 [Eleusine coracana subsp. coracana]